MLLPGGVGGGGDTSEICVFCVEVTCITHNLPVTQLGMLFESAGLYVNLLM